MKHIHFVSRCCKRPAIEHQTQRPYDTDADAYIDDGHDDNEDDDDDDDDDVEKEGDVELMLVLV